MTEQHIHFIARVGAAMSASNYPVTLVREMLERSSGNYGLAVDVVALPNHVQVVGPMGAAGSIVKTANVEKPLRFDQMFPLARLMSAARSARVTPADGEALLDEILDRPAPYRDWVIVLGYGIWSAGLALVLEPTWLNAVTAMVLGLLVGVFWTAGQRMGLAALTPVVSAFAVTAICIVGAQHLGLDHVGLRALIPPLAMFLPGAAITLSVIELTSRDVISGSSRLIAGFIQLIQLAFGILIAAQLLRMNENQLSAAALNRIGLWAPWLGVAVYSVGVMLFFAPPWKFLPWLLLITYAAYLAQFVGGITLGSYASGFCGGLVLTLAALVISRRPTAPPAITLILPAFWLLVPGSMGLIGITELFGAEGDSALPATLISMISVAFGLQAGLVIWQLVRRRHTRRPGAR